jgi:hypothetical protein
MEENNKIELTQENYEIGKYIYSILLSQPTILMSWGFESPVVIRLGLRFKVNGFLYSGLVEVRYNEGADLFDISLVDDDNQIKETLEGIYFDELVDVIDNHVERVDNYNDRVDQEYNFTNNEEKVI